MTRHFVVFLRHGLFLSDASVELPVESWTLSEARRYRKTQDGYGFFFITRERTDDELDSRIVAESGFHFLEGAYVPIEETERRGPSILLDNLREMRAPGSVDFGGRVYAFHSGDVMVDAADWEAAR